MALSTERRQGGKIPTLGTIDGGGNMAKRDPHEEEELLEDDLEEEEEELDDGGVGVGIGLLVGLIIGSILGAGTALLIAPQRGTVVRRRIRPGILTWCSEQVRPASQVLHPGKGLDSLGSGKPEKTELIPELGIPHIGESDEAT